MAYAFLFERVGFVFHLGFCTVTTLVLGARPVAADLRAGRARSATSSSRGLLDSTCRPGCWPRLEGMMETRPHGLSAGFAVALTPLNLMIVLIGCFLGTFVGALPGIGPINGVAILLPIAYGLQVAAGIRR